MLPDSRTLVQNAIDSDVDGLAVTLSASEAIQPAVQAAIDAGIPTVAFNQGFDTWQEYGAMMYFGSDETLAGQTVGERIGEEGGQKALCIIQEQGSAALEARCAGVADTFPNTENINVEGTDLPGTQAALTAKLQEDTSITHLVALGAPIALAGLDSIEQAGSEATMVTFDLNEDAAQAIQDGTDPVLGGSAALCAGVHGRDVVVAERDQRQRHRWWAAGADRSVDRRPEQHRPDPAVHGEQHPLDDRGGRPGSAPSTLVLR